MDSVRFVGNRAIESDELADGLGTQATGMWPWSDARRLDRLAVANDERRIETLYRLQGYYSAEVEHEIDRVAQDRVRVVFRIREGAPTRVEAVDVNLQGDVAPDARGLAQAPLPIAPGDVMTYSAYEEARQALERRFRRSGYALAEVEGRVDVYPERREARVTLTASPGPLHRYGEVRVEGLAAIPAEPVRALARRALPHGARYSPVTIDEAESRLTELGAFRSVRISVGAPRDPAGESVVLVTVEELPVHSVVVGGGVGVDQNLQELRALAEYGNTSFLGGARRLTWRNELALRFLPTFYDPERTGLSPETALELTQPEILDRTSLALRGTYEHAFREAYEADRVAGRVGLAYRLARGTHVVPAVNYERYLDYAARTPRGTAPLSLDCREPCQLTFVSADLVRDRRRDAVAPRSGYLLRAATQYGFPLPNGGFHYVRVEPEVRWYVPVGRRVSAAARVVVGALFAVGDSDDSAPPQRFFGGGQSGHRGFGPEQLAPLVEDAGRGFIPIGGDGLWLTSLELRWRATQRWEIVPFADYGDVTVEPLDIDPGTAHLALGLGVRLFTLAGPIRLDVAYRVPRRTRTALDTGAAVETQPRDFLAFFLSLGEAF